MTPRHKNMLEAFQASTQSPSQPAAPIPGASAAKSKSGSSARARAERLKSPSLEDLPADLERKRLEPVLAVAAGALLLVLAFFLGRFSVGDPALAADDQDASSGESSPSAVTEAGGSDLAGYDLGIGQDVDPNGGVDFEAAPVDDANADTASSLETAEDRAFFDPTNRFTVRAFRYGIDDADRFNADYYRLKDRGLPVVQPVQARDSEWIVLCVGAEPKLGAEIDAILAELQSMPDFASAYVDNIDNVIQR